MRRRQSRFSNSFNHAFFPAGLSLPKGKNPHSITIRSETPFTSSVHSKRTLSFPTVHCGNSRFSLSCISTRPNVPTWNGEYLETNLACWITSLVGTTEYAVSHVRLSYLHGVNRATSYSQHVRISLSVRLGIPRQNSTVCRCDSLKSSSHHLRILH